MALNPVLLAVMSDVAPEESGLASGVVNTSFMLGGALGLAVQASLAAARTAHLLASGIARPAALTGGYQLGLSVAAIFAVGAVLLRARHAEAKRGGEAGSLPSCSGPGPAIQLLESRSE
jgi:MFS family permease